VVPEGEASPVKNDESDSAYETGEVEVAEKDDSTEGRESRRWQLTNQTILAIAKLVLALTTLLALVLHGKGGLA
jgi:hypothetical protein